MRKPTIRYALVVAAAFALLLPALASAQANTTTTNNQVPYAVVTNNNSCLAEPVALNGTLHLLNHVTITNNGEVHLKSHAQPQGITGTGLVSGAKWQATGVTQTQSHVTAPPPTTFTYINNFKIIGQGSAPNFRVHNTTHVTVNANGDTTSSVSNVSVECH